MTSTVYDPIEIEALIAARLTARIKDAGLVKHVYTTKEYEDVGEQSQLVPALVVIYNGLRPETNISSGAVTAILLDYIVVVAVRSSKNTLRGDDAKAKAAAIFIPTLQAIVNWRPASGLRPIQLAEGPGAEYSDAGFCYLPIMCNTRFTLTPAP